MALRMEPRVGLLSWQESAQISSPSVLSLVLSLSKKSFLKR